MAEINSSINPSRKRQLKTDLEGSELRSEKIPRLFCCQTFRQEIKGSQPLKSLKRFIQAAKSSEDCIGEYLACGGSVQEILSLIDVTASGDLTTALPVFQVVHLILLRFQSLGSKHHEKCIEGARTIVNSHLSIIKAMLLMNTTKPKKVALKLLTAIATLDSTFANEIINVIALSPGLISDLIKPTSDKESVRKCFILFLLSFLVEGSPIVLKNLLEKKGVLGSIIPGLKFDEADIVNLTLSLLEDKILKNTKVTKTLKLKLFNTQIIKSLFDLFDWKGPQSIKESDRFHKKVKIKATEVDEKEKEIVLESVYSFLILLCSSKNYGVAFTVKSLGTSNQINNELLLSVLEGLSDPLKNKKMADVILKTLSCCPDLITPILQKLEPLFQPRNSKNWFEAVKFAENLVNEVDVSTLLKNEDEPLSAKRYVKVGLSLCAPTVFLRMIKLGANKSESVDIQLCSLKLLTTLWKEMEKLFALQATRNEMKKSFRYHVLQFLPDVPDLILLWQTLCETKDLSLSFLTLEKTLCLSIVLDVLDIIIECRGETINSLYLTSEVLRHAESLKRMLSVQEFYKILMKIVRFMENDLKSLIINDELFDKCLQILLISADHSSFFYLSKILATLDVFQKNKSEIDVWILCYMSLPKEYCPLVANYFIESLHRCFEFSGETNRLPISFSTRNSILADEIENCISISEQSLTVLIFACLEVYRCHLEKSSGDQELEALRHFLNDVVIRLQHFYSVDLYLYHSLKGFKNMFSKSVLNYLKKWTQNLIEVNDEIFSCPLELRFASWLTSNEDNRKFEEVIDANALNLLQWQYLFRVAIAYLNIKMKNENLLENDVSKFSTALSCILKIDLSKNDQDDDLISNDFDNAFIYQRKCLDSLLSNTLLLDEFDVIRKKQTNSTEVAFNVLIKNEIFKNVLVEKNLANPWKCKFLKGLMSKLRKEKSLNGLHNLEKVLNSFEYDLSDTSEMLNLFTTVSDLNLFVDGNSPSLWVTIMTKFCMWHSQKQELHEDVVKKLCLIMQSFCEKFVSNLNEMDTCFVYLLRTHPRHLLFIDDDFLRVTLQRSNTTLTTHLLAKLLLNDPAKVKCFLKVLKDEVEIIGDPQLLFSLLSSLIVNKDTCLHTFKFKETFMTWKSSEISATNTPSLYKALKSVYKKFHINIYKALAGEKEVLIFNNLNISREIVKLFVHEKRISEIKSGIQLGKFEPELMFEVVRNNKNKELRENYMAGLLTIFCRLIENSTNEENEDTWTKYCDLVSDLIRLKRSSWTSMLTSPIWKEFKKSALGYCFSSGQNPSLLKILRVLTETFYTTQGSQDCGLFFQMVISHSRFLKLILSDNRIKNEMVELFYCLIKRCPSEMSSKHVPILLASYAASLSSCDVTLLKILRLYEENQIKINEYEPFVWGEAAVSHYSIGANRGLSLWQRINMGNVLDLLDEHRMETSLKEFPLHRDLQVYKSQNETYDSVVYDPSFILPLFVNLFSPGSAPLCLAFVHKRGLAYTVRALSSTRRNIRALASLVLARFYSHLELSQKLKQKSVWLHFINCLRYGIENLSAKPLPNIATLFFARMTLELFRHPDGMYLPLQNCFLAKSYFAFDDIPEFLPLFHSSEVSYWKHRKWLLEIIRDGTKAPSDVNLIFHTMAVKILFSFFHCELCDIDTKKLTLQVVEKMLRLDKSIFLISEHGLISWITSIDAESYQPILEDLLLLLSTTFDAILKDIKMHKSTHSDYYHITQILNMTVKILPKLKAIKSVKVFHIYLKLVLKCLVFFAEEGQTQWCKLNKNQLFDLIEAGNVILGESDDIGKFCKLPFYFREFLDCHTEIKEDLKITVFVFNMLLNNDDK